MTKHQRPDCTELRRLFNYDPPTGALTWQVRQGRAVAGDRAGTPRRDQGDRVLVMIHGRFYPAALVIWCWMTGEWPPDGMLVDHKDCDPSNDHWANLRLATKAQNLANCRVKRNSASGMKGAYRSYNKWRAMIGRKSLGYFDSPEAANKAYLQAAKAKYGEFARGA